MSNADQWDLQSVVGERRIHLSHIERLYLGPAECQAHSISFAEIGRPRRDAHPFVLAQRHYRRPTYARVFTAGILSELPNALRTFVGPWKILSKLDGHHW